MISCIDLFCGLGGLTHGLIRGGVDVVAGIDLDAQCQFPYEENNSAKFINRDIQDLTADELRTIWPAKSHTLLAGCTPCQPFSTYSRKGRKKREDDKWGLVADFGRLIGESRPEMVTMENVPQLADHEVFSQFLESLKGYHVWHNILDCKDFGVPQTRKRLVLLASRLGPITFSRDELIEELAAQKLLDEHAGPTVRSAIAHLPKLAAGQTDSRDKLHSACRLSE